MSAPAPGRLAESGIATIVRGRTDVLAFALHAGHEVRGGLRDRVALSDEARLREEDPHTASFAPAGATLVRAQRSRFEVDLNRPRDTAVYLVPDDAWGLEVWSVPPSHAELIESLSLYDEFYDLARRLLVSSLAEHDRVLVLDLHSYNHRRDGASAAPAPAAENPELNVGTRHIDRERWAPVVDGFIEAARGAGFQTGENVKFGGGHFSRWATEGFGDRVCVLAIEFKKTFMDEWTGQPDEGAVQRISAFMDSVTPGVVAALGASE